MNEFTCLDAQSAIKELALVTAEEQGERDAYLHEINLDNEALED